MYKMDLALIIYNDLCAIKPNQIKPNGRHARAGVG